MKIALGLITPDHLKADELFLIDIKYDMFPDDKVKLFKKGQYLALWESSYSPIHKKYTSAQKEYPLAALPWFIDTIENEFWNHKPDPDALPGKTNEVTVIKGEKLGINPMRNCCAEDLFGYSFWNASRKSYISRRARHDWYIPQYMLEQGLMDDLKRISTELGLKSYEPFK
ncbi:hypothetical protein [Hahella ganghwensis]|uniref:hypothetical protein n=1 Tax=Hahella ganghwensis TaxID=286420 RepID=UPI00036FE118|nr:hypothetical protein [Hahella ganghwensis]